MFKVILAFCAIFLISAALANVERQTVFESGDYIVNMTDGISIYKKSSGASPLCGGYPPVCPPPQGQQCFPLQPMCGGIAVRCCV
ncbi:hypothetical protein Ddc_13069 [Ditylenchus destructor]|nr:hypothetical protein Ddc_13069 [Ditylenchus destructor]